MWLSWFFYPGPNAAPIEIFNAWCTIFGVLFNLWCIYDAVMDAIWLWKKNGTIRQDERYRLRLVIIGNIRKECVRLLLQLGLGYLNFFAVYAPPGATPAILSNPTVAMLERQRVAWMWITRLRVGMSIFTMLLTLNAVFETRDRRKLLYSWTHPIESRGGAE